jgi:arylsulfatase A-like enzyme
MKFHSYIFCFLIAFAGGCSSVEEPEAPPNLLFVFADQFRKQSVGFMDQDPVLTPALDQLASEGLAFTNAVSTCPICSPYRAMLMTGRFPMSTGITSNCLPGTDLELDEDEICFGDILKANGYHTGYIGKWHLDIPSLNRSPVPEDSAQDAWDGWTPPGPRRHGFDFWYAYNCNSMHFHPNYWSDSPERIDVTEWSVAHETDVAIEFIQNRPKERPFALFLSWNPPHNPYIAPDTFMTFYESRSGEPRPNVRVDDLYLKRSKGYMAAVSSVDHHFGRLMTALRASGLEENTLVVFTSDHGEMMGSHGRYAKSVWFDESIGIPFIVRWKGKIEPAIEQMPFACYHFMPTLLGLMGIGIPESVEGTSYAEYILGNNRNRAASAVIAGYGNPGHLLAEGQEPSVWAIQADSLHRMGIDWRRTGYRGLRTDRYTYVVDRGRKGAYLSRYLYDHETDPYQLHPVTALLARENETMESLDSLLGVWLTRMHDPFSLE